MDMQELKSSGNRGEAADRPRRRRLHRAVADERGEVQASRSTRPSPAPARTSSFGRNRASTSSPRRSSAKRAAARRRRKSSRMKFPSDLPTHRTGPPTTWRSGKRNTASVSCCRPVCRPARTNPIRRPGPQAAHRGGSAVRGLLQGLLTFSSRRFGSDLADAHEEGYLSANLRVNKVNVILETAEITPYLYDLIIRSGLPLRAVETDFAMD